MLLRRRLFHFATAFLAATVALLGSSWSISQAQSRYPDAELTTILIVLYLLTIVLYWLLTYSYDYLQTCQANAECKRAIAQFAVMYAYSQIRSRYFELYRDPDFDVPQFRINFMILGRDWKSSYRLRLRIYAAYPIKQYVKCEWDIRWGKNQGVVGCALNLGHEQVVNVNRGSGYEATVPRKPQCDRLKSIKTVFTYVVRGKSNYGVLTIDSDSNLLCCSGDQVSSEANMFIDQTMHDATKQILEGTCRTLCDLFEGGGDKVHNNLSRDY